MVDSIDDRDVWLILFHAAMSHGQLGTSDCAKEADCALELYRERWSPKEYIDEFA